MEAFLRSLAGYILREHGNLQQGAGREGDEILVILPNRRAGVFLQHYLRELAGATMWMPRFMGMADFVEEESSLRLADPLEMNFALYDIYSSLVENPPELDEFWAWGEMMLRDFDEMDKYQVDAGQLFRNIRDLKELEEPLAGLDEQQLAFIRQFWENFYAGAGTPEKDSFLRTWELMPLIYERLRTQLGERGEGYQGMLYRNMAEKVLQGGYSPKASQRLIIAGFNALNACEKQIFAALHEQGAAFFWDSDRGYMEDLQHEAGRFLRGNVRLYPDKEKLQDCDSLRRDKDIAIYELPTDVMQAKTLNLLLSEQDPAKLGSAMDTAIVLCDEDLLMPGLLSLPEGIEEVNITMGYPLKNTAVFSFLEALLNLQQNLRRGSSGNWRFYHRDVNEVLLHPLYRAFSERRDGMLEQRIISENMILVDGELFTDDFDRRIFRAVEDARSLIGYLRDLFGDLLGRIAGGERPRELVLEREFCFHLLKQLNKLERLVGEHPGLSSSLLERLLRQAMGSLRVPFEGEPLSGLQIMGILETRMLDFRHIILLSLGEEIMPAKNSQHSHIPYSLRLAFAMPSREEKDAIYAYYFYRLLQRAEKVDILFNGSAEGLSTGEISRYGQQLIYERDIRVRRPGFRILTREVQPIGIDAGERTRSYLEKFLMAPGEAPPTGLCDPKDRDYLSPSALSRFIKCPLSFYFRYVAGLGESREISEDMDVAELGTVVHDALSQLYEEIAAAGERKIRKGELQALIKDKKHEQVLRELFIRKHYRGRANEELEGRNLLIFRVMLHYMEQVIRRDMELGEFELLSSELSYKRSLTLKVGGRELQVKVGGKIDRLDRVNGQVRVIDYKTGMTESRFAGLESLFDRELPRTNSAAMQTLLYSWLVSLEYPGEPLMPGLYSMKGVFAGDFDPALLMARGYQKERITDFRKHEDDFLERLAAVLEELYDPDGHFGQRKDDEGCKWCDYASLCQRKKT